MIWYGNNPRKINNTVKSKKRRLNEKIKLWNINKTTIDRLAYRQHHVYIPPMWNFIIYTNKRTNALAAYIYSSVYFISLALPTANTTVVASPSTSTITITSLRPHNFLNVYFSGTLSVMSAFYRPLFTKIKFKGKGYYIYKNLRNTITPQFGYSHRLYVYAYFMSVKFLSKTSIFVFGFIKSDLSKLSHAIKAMRPINIFTGRGVRFAKQVVYKKAGKISSYR